VTTPDTKTVTITVELTDKEAWDLAQFYKRSSFGHYRDCACDDEEAYRMIHAMGKVSEALREKGYAPR
jgi:hypothetical protein